MNLKSVFFAMFLVPCLFLTGLQTVSAADWRPAGNSQFDASRITCASSSLIRVWEKAVYSKELLLQIQKMTGLDYSRYVYSVDLRQVDCKKRLLGGLSNTDYDSSGNVIRTEKFKKVIMNEVPPGSGGEAFVTAVCNHVDKEVKGKKR